MAMTSEELLAEMERLVEAGDKQALERFALDHFIEFPEDVQGKILSGFLSETLEAEGSEAEIAGIQKEGLETMKELEEIKALIAKGDRGAQS